jgi:SWI/SNF-related matrix-associated actin-dependent regulator of chromatin subfamily A protein 2/4
VFDNQSVFAEWFAEFVGGQPMSSAPGHDPRSEAALWHNEKRMLVITRLHQILEPFMLRRMVGGVWGDALGVFGVGVKGGFWGVFFGG